MSNKDSSLNEDRENVEVKDINLNNNEKKETEISRSQAAFYKFQIDELKEHLEKEEKNSAIATDKWKRALADYQNLEKQIIDRINAREDKIILHFLTVHEDFIRAKNAYEKDGINVEGLNVIIKNMESILDNYEVKAIEAEGKELDPKLHEVVQEVEEDNLEEGTIVKEIAKGYIIRGKVLKYSKVCVSKKLIKK
jgi:molecular chaperone GrpE